MNKADIDSMLFHWRRSSDDITIANTAWREHVATLDVAREYWG